MEILVALRPHQWLKNSLLFVPLFTSQTNLDMAFLKLAMLGFVGFSMVCSGNYIANDLIDFESDQGVVYKSQKPIASGKIRKEPAIFLATLLLVLGLVLCWYASSNFLLLTIIYLCLGLLYSKFLKRIPQLDIVILVLFYEIRIFAGGALFDLTISFWLIIFSFTVFSSLAFVKKCSKAAIQYSQYLEDSPDYLKRSESNYLSQFGISYAVLSLLTFALYLNSEEIRIIYTEPRLLWFLIPLLQFLLLRTWSATLSGRMHYDPIVFILRDRITCICLCLMLFVVGVIEKVN